MKVRVSRQWRIKGKYCDYWLTDVDPLPWDFFWELYHGAKFECRTIEIKEDFYLNCPLKELWQKDDENIYKKEQKQLLEKLLKISDNIKEYT